MAAGCTLETSGGLPLRCRGRMRPGRFELPGNVSSQYISGLLLAAPLLGEASEVVVTGAIESRPYVDLTVEVLAAFGVEVEVIPAATEAGVPTTTFRIPATSYRTPARSRSRATGPTPRSGCAPARSAPMR